METLPKRTAAEMYWRGILFPCPPSYGSLLGFVLLLIAGDGFANVDIVDFVVVHNYCL